MITILIKIIPQHQNVKVVRKTPMVSKTLVALKGGISISESLIIVRWRPNPNLTIPPVRTVWIRRSGVRRMHWTGSSRKRGIRLGMWTKRTLRRMEASRSLEPLIRGSRTRIRITVVAISTCNIPMRTAMWICRVRRLTRKPSWTNSVITKLSLSTPIKVWHPEAAGTKLTHRPVESHQGERG